MAFPLHSKLENCPLSIAGRHWHDQSHVVMLLPRVLTCVLTLSICKWRAWAQIMLAAMLYSLSISACCNAPQPQHAHDRVLRGFQVTESKAGRCFYAAHAQLATGKELEAHALFGRAAEHAKQAVRQHQVRLT